MTTIGLRPDGFAATQQREARRAVIEPPEARWALLATGLFALGGLAQVVGTPAVLWWALYLACYVSGGWHQAVAGVTALRAGSLDVDLLMIVAAVAAAAIGQVFDGALLIIIFATSGALEAFMTRRTADSVRALLDLAPDRATRMVGTAAEVVGTAELRVGDVMLVRPGERVGADATVLEGVSELDQSSITGEPLPRYVTHGHDVFAGSLNGTGSLRLRVTAPATESIVARLATMVEQASHTKARSQLFIEKVESRYAILVVTATLALIAVPLLAGGALTPTLLRAMTFMIVASPCAIVLATMPPLLSAIANAGRHGALVKSAVVMEKLQHTTLIAFDKTGTLTEGTPRVVAVTPVDGAPVPTTTATQRRSAASALDIDAVLTLAAAAERDSEHPVGRAVAAAAQERGLPALAAADFRSAPGKGVTATVDGHRVGVGSPILLDHRAADDGVRAAAASGSQLVTRVETDGHTAVVVLIDDIPAAVIALADRARPEARRTVAALTTLTGHTPLLLTGDNPHAAARLADRVGIPDVRAGLLPADKVQAVTTLEAAGHHVLLVGDGVNDAPAMATAHLGVAMGRRGSDLALQAADAVIVRDDLTTVPALLELSRHAHRVVRINLALAAAVIVGLVTWNTIGTLPLPLGVAGHEGSTLLVGLNGVRLLRSATWRHATQHTTPAAA